MQPSQLLRPGPTSCRVPGHLNASLVYLDCGLVITLVIHNIGQIIQRSSFIDFASKHLRDSKRLLS
jgi:hypothetical protein